ncbi:MAG: hypothetical protein DPW11_03765 [bacterium]|nr:hypothetical protein [Candidatus Microgenomates bacterium CPR3]MCQ3944866.1 hypothetical protein [bacterium]RIK52104.1 MAG: hypothetical protein DCC61_00860 [Candidatus Microgenomates bacterium]
MPDTINKQTLINLLIDSPLREPIKINLIDIVNNTSEPDLPKVYPTIVKELEIFQKATERRMKLAEETIAKLSGNSQPDTSLPPAVDSVPPVSSQTDKPNPILPPLDLPPLPTPQPPSPAAATPLSVPPLDLPPMPAVPTPAEPPTPPTTEPPAPAVPSSLPSPEPLGGPVATQSSDEAALAEIQKELESLKAGVTADATQTTNPAPAPTA